MLFLVYSEATVAPADWQIGRELRSVMLCGPLAA